MPWKLINLIFWSVLIIHGEEFVDGATETAQKAVGLVRVRTRAYADVSTYVKTGSCFAISRRGHFLTAYHVVEPFGTDDLGTRLPREVLEVHIEIGDHKLPARLAAVDKERDLALLVTDPVDLPPIDRQPPEQINPGQSARVFGFPNGTQTKKLDIRSGQVAKIHRTGGVEQMIELRCAFDPGISGGPVLDARGRLLGVAKAYAKKDEVRCFVVPAIHAIAMCRDVNLARPWPEKVGIKLFTHPSQAQVTVDGWKIGQTPIDMLLPVRPQQIVVSAPNHDAEILNGVNAPETTQNILLQKAHALDLTGAPIPEPPPELQADIALPLPGPELLTAGFHKSVTALKGTTDWQLAGGGLDLVETSPQMHTLLFGEQGWDNYQFSASLSMKGNDMKARSGLIIRASERGFLLFRILQEGNRAQLVWHNHVPFGWLVLKEKKLKKPLKAVNQLQVYAFENNVACTLNGSLVFSLASTLSPKGRIGVYGASTLTSFRQIRLHETAPFRVASLPDGPPQSFWLYDRFNSKSVYWHTLDRGEFGAMPDWLLTNHGGVVRKQQQRNVTVCSRVNLHEFTSDLVLKMGSSGQGEFGFTFGNRGGSMPRFEAVLSETDGVSRLIYVDTQGSRMLAEQPLPADALLFGSPVSRLILDVRTDRIQLRTPSCVLFTHTLKAPLPATGKFGIVTHRNEFILRGLMISSTSNPELVQ